MSQDANDCLGARPLSAFSTTEIVDSTEEEETSAATIGITPLHNTTTTTVLSDDTQDSQQELNNREDASSILLSQDNHVFGLLDDPHADPPIESGGGASSETARLTSSKEQQDGESSVEEYHSPLEDDNNKGETTTTTKPIMNASPFDYNVNWDMIGTTTTTSREEEMQNTSLADAAAASMIASTTATEEPPPAIPPQQPFSFRKSASAGRRNPYRYQKYSEDDEDDLLEMAPPSAEEQPTAETVVSEMNEATSTTSSDGTTPSATRRRRRHVRASSFSSPSRNNATLGAQQQQQVSSSGGRASSLDSGMAAVRRWIRARASGSGGSSRAARRWQRESSLQLGEEDLFALTHAGEDRRRDFFPSILEEEDMFGGSRQRALSEPNSSSLRNFIFHRAANGGGGGPPTSSSRSFRARAGGGVARSSSLSLDEADAVSSRSGASALSTSISVPTHLSSAALNSSLFHSPQRGATGDLSVNGEVVEQRANDGDVSSLAETSVVPPSSPAEEEEDDDDPNREARTRWIRINRRFQLIITVVALLFSLLLFAILVCWVVFTSAYVVSIDKSCDVPLKQYFWLATLQLILDVFRTDIMRFIFRWDTHSNDRIPVRVIMYNVAYLVYALLVLRMGVRAVFMADESTCPSTAPELYQSAAAFVSLSIAAWSTIVLGYLVPFCFVATLLTWNGYSPTADNPQQNANAPFPGGVFPAAYSTTGAPPGCVDQLRTVLLEEFPDDYPRECCICMGDFVTGEVIVATECQHVFHKRCCQEWLRQARTCPVCRMDIPSSLPNSGSEEDEAVPQQPPPTSRLTRPFPGREDFHQDVVGLLQILRRQETRLRQRNSSSEHAADPNSTVGDGGSSSESPGVVRSESLTVGGGSSRETEMVSLEEGRVNRQHSR